MYMICRRNRIPDALTQYLLSELAAEADRAEEIPTLEEIRAAKEVKEYVLVSIWDLVKSWPDLWEMSESF